MLARPSDELEAPLKHLLAGRSSASDPCSLVCYQHPGLWCGPQRSNFNRNVSAGTVLSAPELPLKVHSGRVNDRLFQVVWGTGVLGKVQSIQVPVKVCKERFQPKKSLEMGYHITQRKKNGQGYGNSGLNTPVTSYQVMWIHLGKTGVTAKARLFYYRYTIPI